MADPDPVSRGRSESLKIAPKNVQYIKCGGRSSLIRSTTPSLACTRRPDEFGTNGISSTRRSEQVRSRRRRHGGAAVEAAAMRFWEERGRPLASTCVTLNGSGIQLAVGPQPLWLRNRNFGLAQRIMVKRLATSRHDPLDNIGYPRMRANGESSTKKHRLLHASGPHPIPPPNDPKWVGKWVKVRRLSYRVSITFRVVRTNQYNQDLGLIHSTNGNHLESPNEGSSINHQVTIHLHAQNIPMFCWGTVADPDPVSRRGSGRTKLGWETSTTGRETPSSACIRRPDEISADGFSSKDWSEQVPAREAAAWRRRPAAAFVRGRGGALRC
ncbi:hypothetical protein F511_30425 [Dorcoceras hygrometricum]|uniref:Uncharacterized protein n=1 Tax=Dorcoceras hygrometricum TaxID=472368 RepID=A0A2Z7AY67_9LAMI|nr:hypothetical protein F511_30425 [Dorcoceras hygrometricum]